MLNKDNNVKLIREASAVSVLAVLSAVGIGIGAFVMGRKEGTKQGEQDGYKAGAIDQFKLERENELNVKQGIGFDTNDILVEMNYDPDEELEEDDEDD